MADGGQDDGDHDRWRAFEWADPAIAAAAARELDGITFFRELIAGRIPPPPITAALGFTLASVEPGTAVFEITPADYHYTKSSRAVAARRTDAQQVRRNRRPYSGAAADVASASGAVP